MSDVIDNIAAKQILAFNVKRILAARENKGLPHSRYWLAKQLNVTDARIKQICDGIHEPGWSFVINMAEVLDVEPDELSRPIRINKNRKNLQMVS